MSAPIRSTESKVQPQRLGDRREPAPAEHARSGGAADEHGRDVQHDVVDRGRPAPDSTRAWRRPRPAPPGRLVCRGDAGARAATRRRRRRARGPPPRLPQRSTRGSAFRREVGRGDQRRCRSVEQMPGGRHPARGVDHDAHRRRASAKRASRTVSEGSSAIAVPAPTTTASAQARSRCTSARDGLAGDPSGGTVGGRGLAVEARGHLQRDEREAARDVPFERPVQAPRLGGHHADFDLDAGVAELHEAGLSSPRFGSVVPPPPGRRRPRSARGCRVACDRSGCTARACRPRWPRVRGRRRRRGPSPRRAGCRGPRASPRRAPSRRVVDDEGAHHGIGRDPAPAAFGELERPPHLGLSCCLHASPRSVRPRRGGGERQAMRLAACAQRSPVVAFTRSLPSRLSRSAPESHRVHPPLAAAGSRTVTAGGELHPAPETVGCLPPVYGAKQGSR